MESKFEEYILNWFSDFVVENDSEDALLELFNLFTGRKDEPLENWLDKDEDIYDYLKKYDDADDIYRQLLFIRHDFDYVELPNKEEVILKMLKEAVDELGLEKYDFVQEFIEDMVDHIVCYDNPKSFFDDLRHGGCGSGMIGMLIYNHDCLKLYGKYAVDMEEYKEDMEEEFGEPIRQRDGNRIYHYVWMCWLCYEELAFSIARYLWEESF